MMESTSPRVPPNYGSCTDHFLRSSKLLVFFLEPHAGSSSLAPLHSRLKLQGCSANSSFGNHLLSPKSPSFSGVLVLSFFCLCSSTPFNSRPPRTSPIATHPHPHPHQHHPPTVTMDDRELSSRIKDLTKALASEAPPIVIKLLEDLKKDTAPTEEQLRV